MSDQQINVHVNSGATEIIRIVATVLLFGGVGAIAWAVAQGAYAEMAATGMAMMIVTLTKLMYSRGLITMPTRTGEEDQFAATKSVMAQVSGEYRRWLSGTSMPAMVLIAVVYAIAFLVLRAGVSAAMGVFQNVWIAGGAAAVVGAIVVFPSLVPGMISGLKSKGVVATPATEPIAAPAQRVPTASAAPKQQIPAPAPQVAEAVPAASAAPSTKPVQQRVVRRVVKKESTNE